MVFKNYFVIFCKNRNNILKLKSRDNHKIWEEYIIKQPLKYNL